MLMIKKMSIKRTQQNRNIKDRHRARERGREKAPKCKKKQLPTLYIYI